MATALDFLHDRLSLSQTDITCHSTPPPLSCLILLPSKSQRRQSINTLPTNSPLLQTFWLRRTAARGSPSVWLGDSLQIFPPKEPNLHAQLKPNLRTDIGAVSNASKHPIYCVHAPPRRTPLPIVPLPLQTTTTSFQSRTTRRVKPVSDRVSPSEGKQTNMNEMDTHLPGEPY